MRDHVSAIAGLMATAKRSRTVIRTTILPEQSVFNWKYRNARQGCQDFCIFRKT
jgi:hypothetical protein